ncbi:hypothetical protein OIU76_027277 [Salix suchowensis]|nr:hypothetical protein OIU76_027277 [Salix suchowensis]
MNPSIPPLLLTPKIKKLRQPISLLSKFMTRYKNLMGSFKSKRKKNFKREDHEQTLEEIYSKLQGNKLSKSSSDTKPTSGEVPKKLPKKMKKSASAKSAFAHFEENDIVESRRPATVRERKTTTEVDDTEVDAKADDFINRFKQQLKLQRMNSIMRYKEMIGRRS